MHRDDELVLVLEDHFFPPVEGKAGHGAGRVAAGFAVAAVAAADGFGGVVAVGEHEEEDGNQVGTPFDFPLVTSLRIRRHQIIDHNYLDRVRANLADLHVHPISAGFNWNRHILRQVGIEIRCD